MIKLKHIFIIIHLLIISITVSYSFIIKDKTYDNIYILFIYLKLFHWTLLNGECIISYLYKKYIADKNEIYNNEFEDSFKYNKNIIHIFIILITILTIINIYNVFNRNNYSYILMILFIILYITYIYKVYLFKNYHNNKNFYKSQSIIQLLIILWGMLLVT